MVKLAVVMLTFVVCGPQKDTLGSVDLLRPVAMLMSVLHVTPKGHVVCAATWDHVDSHGPGFHQRAYWYLWLMLLQRTC